MDPEILFISPHSEDAQRLACILGSISVKLEHVQSLSQARAKLQRGRYRAILTEADLPDGGWTDVLDAAREISPDAEVIVTDAFADAQLWTEVLSLGAYDLLAQPFYDSEVRRILSNACGGAAGRSCSGAGFYNGFSA